MEVVQRVCQSAYGTYIRGATTIAARYIGHPAVAIPASEMIKTMMEEAAPKVNYLVQLETGSKQGSIIKEEKNRIDKHTSGRFEYLKGCTNGWYTGFTKAIKGEQVIDQKYTLENLFSGNLTVEDMPDFPEYMTMVGAVIGAKYRGLWNSAKGTYDGVVTLVTDPEKVLEVASDAILDFMEDPWENTKELAGNIRDSVVDAVWRSTPQEISEDAGEILGDVLTGLATGGGGKAAAGGAKMAGNKLLALGKTGAKEFVEGLGDLGKIGAKNAVYVGATTGMENASKNAFRNRLMMMASETGDKAKKVTGIAEGATSKVDDIATIAGKTGSVANNVTSTTGELIENAVIGTPIVEGTKNITKEIVEGTTEKTTLQMLEEATDDIVEAGTKVTSKVDDVAEAGAQAGSKADDIVEAGVKANSKANDTAKAAGQTTARTVVKENSGVNGSGVKISGEKPNSNVDDIKTRETSNSIGNAEKPKETNNNTSNSNAADTNNAKPIIDIEFQNAAQIRVKELRNQLPNSDLRKYGNVATADVDIAGIKKEFYAHSKINSFEDKGSNIAEFSYLKSESERNFSSYKIDRYPRYHDTEAKILEDIASQIKEPNISGTINLFTERPPCESCSNIIEEFKEKFPNIELNVFSEKGKWIDLKKKGEKS